MEVNVGTTASTGIFEIEFLGVNGYEWTATEADWGGKNLINVGLLNFGTATELTIAAGVITVTQSYHTVDTESDAPADDLDTINGGTEGDIIILRSTVNARDIIIRDGTGNINMLNDFTLANVNDKIMLIFNGSNWNPLSRSTNN